MDKLHASLSLDIFTANRMQTADSSMWPRMQRSRLTTHTHTHTFPPVSSPPEPGCYCEGVLPCRCVGGGGMWGTETVDGGVLASSVYVPVTYFQFHMPVFCPLSFHLNSIIVNLDLEALRCTQT